MIPFYLYYQFIGYILLIFSVRSRVYNIHLSFITEPFQIIMYECTYGMGISIILPILLSFCAVVYFTFLYVTNLDTLLLFLIYTVIYLLGWLKIQMSFVFTFIFFPCFWTSSFLCVPVRFLCVSWVTVWFHISSAWSIFFNTSCVQVS